MRKMIKTNCTQCGIEFYKPKSEFDLNQKLNKNNFCNRTCVGFFNVKNLPKLAIGLKNLNPYNRSDEFSKYKEYLRRIKRRQGKTNLTLPYLKQIFISQNERCVYSKVKLKHPNKAKNKSNIYTASLDRIDSSKPYEIGNVQFVSISMNHMKNSMSHEDTLELIKIIKNS